MNSFYQKYIDKENEYYSALQVGQPASGEITPKVLNDALNWLCEDAESILDFGCGSGGLLFCCSFRNVCKLVGIDLAADGIRYAESCTVFLPESEFSFLHGSFEKLITVPDCCFDGLILSNILDNMRPEDALTALRECVRCLKPGGKTIIKLNSYLTAEAIKEWNVKVLDGDLLDDGMLLWNQPDEMWLKRLHCYFTEVNQKDVFFEEYDMHNRLFLCVK